MAAAADGLEAATWGGGEVPLSNFHSAKAKMDELFFKWLSMGETRSLFEGLVRDVQAGKPIHIPTSSLSSSARPGGILQSPRRTQATPPLSPSAKKAPTPDGSASPKHFTFDDGGPVAQSPKQQGTAEARPTPLAEATGVVPADAGAGASAAVSPVRQRRPAGGAAPSERTPPAATSDPYGGKVSERSGSPAQRPSAAGAVPPASQTPVGFAARSLAPFYVPGEGGRGRGKPLPEQGLPGKLDDILKVWRAGAGKEFPPIPPGEAPVTIAGVSILPTEARVGLPVEQFAAVAKTLCGFPSFFAAPLFRRIRHAFGKARFLDSDMPRAGAPAAPASYPLKPGRAELPTKATADETAPVEGEGADRDTTGTVSLYQFLRYWRAEMEPYDHFDRFLRLVSQRGPAQLPTGRKLKVRALVPGDFMPLLEELLAFHPGLAFLETTPEFQEKYARTVIARMFYSLDPTARQCITGRALRQGSLLRAFHVVDMEEDINLVNDFFSYEHFYVLYCKFWELDGDHDFLLSREDLAKLTDLTDIVLDRVFEEAGRPFTSGTPGRMGYEDFICFLMSEEDKTSPEALRYWFNVVDLNHDGVLTPDEMRAFYTQQHARMVELGMEAVGFQDLMTQMSDLLHARKPGHFTLSDFLHPSRVKLTGVLFSSLFNISKFQAFEARDAVLVKQQLNSEGISQWDRYASVEYMRLAEEEEGGIDDNMNFDVEGGGQRWG